VEGLDLECLDDSLYAAWTEDDTGGVAQVRVAQFNGNTGSPAWTLVDGGAASGLNFASTREAMGPSLEVAQGFLFLAWSEQNSGGVAQARVAAFNGSVASPSWVFSDGGGANGLNYDAATYNANNVQLGVISGANERLVLFWTENNGGGPSATDQIRVRTGALAE